MDILGLTNEIFDEMVAWRRDFHQYPEMSYEEHRTSQMVYSRLKEFGLDQVEYMCGTAVVGVLYGTAGPGRCLAIRADMDGLPVTEQTGYSYCSKTPGLMHACGHDGHTAMLLAVAKILSQQRGEFRGCVKFIFEHAEEKFPGGAKLLVQAGVMERPHVDAIIGLHIVPSEESGKLRVISGPVCMGCDLANITFTGKSGHAAKPHLANDALLAACEYVVALQQIVSRAVDPIKTGIVSVGTLQSGTAVNIIADHAVLSLNARAYDNQTREIIREKLFAIAEGIEKISECSVQIDYVEGYEAIINDLEIVDVVQKGCRKVLGEQSVEEQGFDLGSDDFSYFMNATNTPGAYCFLLAGHEGDTIFANHHPCFAWKEEAMRTGVEAILASTLEYLNS